MRRDQWPGEDLTPQPPLRRGEGEQGHTEYDFLSNQGGAAASSRLRISASEHDDLVQNAIEALLDFVIGEPDGS